MKRREFITLPATSLGGVLLYTLAGEPLRVQAQTGDVRVPLRFFTAAEARVVEAACAKIFPRTTGRVGVERPQADLPRWGRMRRVEIRRTDSPAPFEQGPTPGSSLRSK